MSSRRFLDEVQSHSIENKMSVQNLATVFGPNILRPKVEDPVSMMEGEYLQTLQYLQLETNYLSHFKSFFRNLPGSAPDDGVDQ